MIVRGTTTIQDRFDRAQTLATTPGHNGWTVKDTSAAGLPTYQTTADGMVLSMEATAEAQIVTMYQNNILVYELARLQRVWWIAKVAAVNAVTTLVMGVASAQNDTSDTVSINAWLRMEGSASTSNLVAEVDDDVTNVDDVATGKTLAAVFKKLEIDFTNGLADVRFLIDGDRVAAATTFAMAPTSATQGVQPYIQLQKASGATVPSLTIREFGVVYNYAVGA